MDWLSTAKSLLNKGSEAVVLERLARGGGATNWWHIRRVEDLDQVAERLRPGSVVSAYFDGRLRRMEWFPRGHDRAVEVLETVGEVCVGLVGADGVSIDMEFVGDVHDLWSFEALLGEDAEVIVGAFPARSNDGVNAITFTVPDSDGVTRAHPH